MLPPPNPRSGANIALCVDLGILSEREFASWFLAGGKRKHHEQGDGHTCRPIRHATVRIRLLLSSDWGTNLGTAQVLVQNRANFALKFLSEEASPHRGLSEQAASASS
jgi:hypothetical protein